MKDRLRRLGKIVETWNRLRKGLHVYFQFLALRFAKFGRERELEMPSYAQPIYRQISLANKILSSGGGGRVLSNY